MELQGKTALVTGGASGIGAAIVRSFAAQGARVCIADLDLDAARRTAEPLGALAVRMDVCDEDEVECGVAQAADTLGGIDILISNAGVQHLDYLADLSFANWRRILAIHLDGGFLTSRACLRHMIAQHRGGTILLMGSVHSKEASVQKGPYVVAKHGLAGLCRTLAKEGAPHGVRANLICPGFVRTPLVEQQIPVLAAQHGVDEATVQRQIMLGATVDGEFTTVEDVANVARFLAGFGSAALTGQSIVVSHGWHMN